MINLNMAETPEDPGIEVDFDDVQLFAQPKPAGDFDDDCDVDLDDFGRLVLCTGGPAQPPLGSCPPGVDTDLDDDGDVDLVDYSLFSLQFMDGT